MHPRMADQPTVDACRRAQLSLLHPVVDDLLRLREELLVQASEPANLQAVGVPELMVPGELNVKKVFAELRRCPVADKLTVPAVQQVAKLDQVETGLPGAGSVNRADSLQQSTQAADI